VSQFFYLPIFTLLGMTLPWEAWRELGPTAFALVVAILAARRLPAVMLVTLPLRSLHDRRERAYLGWFGPIGVSTLLYAMLAVERTGVEEAWVVGSLLVFASVAAHGMTSNPLTNAYARSSRGGER
jgi:sodium/hydrogen antiporter